MGTRGLLGLISKQGKQRNATYNHYDSYPSALGTTIVEFILSLKPEEWDEMAEKVEGIEWVNEKDTPPLALQAKYSALGYSNLAVSHQKLSDWYCLLHLLQNGAVLPAIQSGNCVHLADQLDFHKDGLFCEWAYFIDFENRVLESYKGAELLNTTSFGELSLGTMDVVELKGRGGESEGID